MRSRIILLLLGIYLTLGDSISPAFAKERLMRRLDERDGMPTASVRCLTQDTVGFLWIGTTGGLARHDGVRTRPWGHDRLREVVAFVAAGPSGQVVAGDDRGAVFEVTREGLSPLAGPAGTPLSSVRDVGFASDDSLLAVLDDNMLVRDADGDWSTFAVGHFSGEKPLRVRPAADGYTFVITTGGLWRIGRASAPFKEWSATGIMDAIERTDGSLVLLRWSKKEDGQVLSIRNGHETTLFSLAARPIDLVQRGEVTWASFDRYLVALRPGEDPEVLGPQDGLPSGGPLHVDPEGSLWLGTFRGLVQYPEPDTMTWNELDGLPSAHGRYITRSDEGIWTITWQGLGLLRPGPHSSWRGVAHGPIGRQACLDSRRRLWTGSLGRVLERYEGRWVEHLPSTGPLGIFSCARASDGSLWMVRNEELLKTPLVDGSPVSLPRPLPTKDDPSPYLLVLEDSSGRLWVTRDRTVCHASAREVASSTSPAWSCEIVDGIIHLTDIIEAEPGVIWLSARGGVFRRDRGGWLRIPASRDLASEEILSLNASPSGGIWVGGQGTLVRVEDRPDLTGGWRVLETLSWWHGLPSRGVADVIDEPDGTFWLTSSAGVTRVPVTARRSAMAAPTVQMVELLVDGRRAATDGPLRLPYRRNRLELHFAALSFRDPSLVRYRVRLHPEDPWSEPTDQPFFRFVDLPPGRCDVEVSASLDGVNWSGVSARIAFRVDRPFYLQAWFLLPAGILVALAAVGWHRARVATVRRLERQRARIAMDLHDEMGSTLGSIGILAGMASDESVDVPRRAAIAAKIAEAAADLGNTLSDIVWSLRPASTRLDVLAYHLVERAGRLLPGEKPRLTSDFPTQWPEVRLSLGVTRNLQLIALEALHNAARHSGARQVTLGVSPDGGSRWKLWVADDGSGLTPDRPHEPSQNRSSGLGLNSMRRRAEEIGAEISWSVPDGGGTIVSVLFDPTARERHVRHGDIA